jgi:hypothetical protein
LPTQKLEEEKIEDILRTSSIYRGDMIFHPIQLIHLPLIFYLSTASSPGHESSSASPHAFPQSFAPFVLTSIKRIRSSLGRDE